MARLVGTTLLSPLLHPPLFPHAVIDCTWRHRSRIALYRDIARSVRPSPTLPRSVVLPTIVLARLWLVTAQNIDLAAHHPDYGRFFVVQESRGTWRGCR